MTYEKPRLLDRTEVTTDTNGADSGHVRECPFCGSRDVMTFFTEEAGTWDVQCQRCGAMPYIKRTEAEAIAAWNRRAEL